MFVAEAMTEALGYPFDPTMISKMESGKRSVSANEAVFLAKFFGMSSEQFFDAFNAGPLEDRAPELPDDELAEFMEVYIDSPIPYEVAA